MFNSTHTLVGLVLGRTGLGRSVPYATWTAVIAANLPDIDIVAQLISTPTYIDHHRGITHTIVGTPILSIALAYVMSRIVALNKDNPRESRRHGNFSGYFLIAILAMATHPLLDWTNTYGIRPFLPLSGRWYYGDTLFIIDPYLDLVLLLGLILSHKVATRKSIIAACTFILALIYIGIMFELRTITGRQFALYTERIPGVVRSAVGPEFINPFQWIGFIETTTEVSSFRIDALTGEIRNEGRLLKTAESPVTAAANSTHTAAVFRGFARFPVTRVQRSPSGYRVLLIDFRFFRPALHTALSAEILLDTDLRVVAESMSFVRSLD